MTVVVQLPPDDGARRDIGDFEAEVLCHRYDRASIDIRFSSPDLLFLFDFAPLYSPESLKIIHRFRDPERELEAGWGAI